MPWGGSRGVRVVCARGTYLVIKVGVNVFGRDDFFCDFLVVFKKRGLAPPVGPAAFCGSDPLWSLWGS